MKFNKEFKILYPEGNSRSLEADNLERHLVERDLKALVDTRLNFSQQCSLSTEKANGVLGYTERSDDSWLRNGILHHYSALVRSQLQQGHGNATSTMEELKNLT